MLIHREQGRSRGVSLQKRTLEPHTSVCQKQRTVPQWPRPWHPAQHGKPFGIPSTGGSFGGARLVCSSVGQRRPCRHQIALSCQKIGTTGPGVDGSPAARTLPAARRDGGAALDRKASIEARWEWALHETTPRRAGARAGLLTASALCRPEGITPLAGTPPVQLRSSP